MDVELRLNDGDMSNECVKVDGGDNTPKVARPAWTWRLLTLVRLCKSCLGLFRSNASSFAMELRPVNGVIRNLSNSSEAACVSEFNAAGGSLGVCQDALNSGMEGTSRLGLCREGARSFASTPVLSMKGTKSMGRGVWNKSELIKLGRIEEIRTISEGGISVSLGIDAVKEEYGEAGASHIFNLLGRRHPYQFLNSKLKRRWSHIGDFQPVMVSTDCFVCIFENHEDRDAVLMGGRWIVTGQIIGMDRWTPRQLPCKD